MAERLRSSGSTPTPGRGRWLRSLLGLLLTLGLAIALLHHGPAGAGDGRSSLKPGDGLLQPPAMQPQPVRRRDLYRRLEPVPPALAAAPRIRLGVHLENCYFISIALFVLFVWGTNVHATAEADPSTEAAAAIRQRVDRADRRFQVISLIGLALVLVLAYLF